MRQYFRQTIYNYPALARKLLGLFIRLHNYSYKKITEYASVLNGGINPKHQITGYHQYFLSHINKSDSVLDIGCGGGLLAYDLAKKASEVVAIDISSRNIEYARSHFSSDNLEFLVGDATVYPFSRRFDKVILSNVLEHISDRVGLLKKLAGLGDVLLLRVPMITREWMSVYKRDHGYPYKLDDTHEIEYTLGDIEKEAGAAGWRVDSYQVDWGEFWGVLKH